MKSTASMLESLDGLTDTTDLTEWENNFVISVLNQIEKGKMVTDLSGKQIEIIEKIYLKHFAA